MTVPTRGSKFLYELPPSDKQWQIAHYKAPDGKTYIIAANPDHPPMIFEDGVFKEIDIVSTN